MLDAHPPTAAAAEAAPDEVGPDEADSLDAQIFDGLASVISDVVAHAERVARQFGVPAPFLKALHLLDSPMAMKDLGRRMHCDPSFITAVADMLEARGLAVRQPDPADRRVRRISLTPAGHDLKQRVEAEMLRHAPWRSALGPAERACLLSHLRAMIACPASGQRTAPPAPGTTLAGEGVIRAPESSAGAGM